MKYSFFTVLLTATALAMALFNTMVFVIGPSSWMGQTLGASAVPDIPVSHSDRVYTADQFSDTVSVTVRGQNYISVLDGTTYQEKNRIVVPNGPGMTIFSPDGKYGYVCSSFTPETVVISVANHTIVGRVPQASPFCPNIAATPDGEQVWFTLKDIGKTEVFDAHPPFSVLKTIDTGPITNHVNIVHNAKGTFAYVTVGGLNEVQVFRTDNFSKVATIPVGKLPHGIWP